MKCIYCGSDIQKERVEFLRSEGREMVCVSCQEEMENSGEYKEYRGMIVSDGKTYGFEKVKGEGCADPFAIYGRVRSIHPEVD